MTEKAYLWLQANSRGRIFGCKVMDHQVKRVRKIIIDKIPGKAGRPISCVLVLYRINDSHLKDTLHANLADLFGEMAGFWVHNKIKMSISSRCYPNGKYRAGTPERY